MPQVAQRPSPLFVFVALAVASAPASATAQRTFVASHGIDSNVCSTAAPCRSFGRALTQTIDGGEVIVLASAGYGPVAVMQSVSIIAPPGVYAGVSVPAGGNETGVLIASVGVNVVLRGLTINSTGGTYGIRMTDGFELPSKIAPSPMS